jgi:hypothetical protein
MRSYFKSYSQLELKVKMSQTVEDIRDNVVKIIDDDSNTFHGTGFLIEVKGSKYCITCHHCICNVNKIRVERERKLVVCRMV